VTRETQATSNLLFAFLIDGVALQSGAIGEPEPTTFTRL